MRGSEGSWVSAPCLGDGDAVGALVLDFVVKPEEIGIEQAACYSLAALEPLVMQLLICVGWKLDIIEAAEADSLATTPSLPFKESASFYLNDIE